MSSYNPLSSAAITDPESYWRRLRTEDRRRRQPRELSHRRPADVGLVPRSVRPTRPGPKQAWNPDSEVRLYFEDLAAE